MTNEWIAPGRLGDPSMDLQTDPRTDPNLLQKLKDLHMAGNLVMPFPTEGISEAELEAIMADSNQHMQQMYDTLPNELPSDEDEPTIVQKTITIDSFDNAKINLHLFFPTTHKLGQHNKAIPAVLYYHGGGMTIVNVVNKVHIRWCTSLALQGLVVVLVGFRNAWNPYEKQQARFPVGLNDCAAAARYIHEHRGGLGVSKIVLQGESGGGNLSLAVALKANQEGWIDSISGVSVQSPYISNAYGWSEERKRQELPSLVECEGYFLECGRLDAIAKWYAPSDKANPLAWPYYATEADMKNLPPHMISVAELEPLKSEGLAYFRKLCAAGVKATGEIELGIVHAAFLQWRQTLPQQHEKAARNIAAFAQSL